MHDRSIPLHALYFAFTLFACKEQAPPTKPVERPLPTGVEGTAATATKAEKSAPPQEAQAQQRFVDAVAVSPANYKVLHENEWMRLILGTFPPGAKDNAHSHPQHYVYALTPIQGREHGADGAHEVNHPKDFVEVRQARNGLSFENTSSSEVRFLIAEIEPELPPVPPIDGAAGDSLAVSPEHYKLLAETDRTRMLMISLEPGKSDKPHYIPPQVTYTLTPVKARVNIGELHLVTRPVGDVAPQEPIAALTMQNIGKAESRVLAIQLKIVTK